MAYLETYPIKLTISAMAYLMKVIVYKEIIARADVKVFGQKK